MLLCDVANFLLMLLILYGSFSVFHSQFLIFFVVRMYVCVSTALCCVCRMVLMLTLQQCVSSCAVTSVAMKRWCRPQ